jgi:outer membrane protein assembly factor BamB
MSLIDLGEVRHGATGPTVPVNFRRIRRTALAVLAVLGVLVLAGSARPAPPRVRPLWTATVGEMDTVALGADTVYLTRKVNTAGPEVAAYDAATGALRWSAPTGDTVSVVEPYPIGDLVLVPTGQFIVTKVDSDGRYQYPFARHTVALDASTGAERWRTAGQIDSTQPDGTGLVSEHDERGGVTRLRLVRVSDGHELWSRSMPAAVDRAVTWHGDRLDEIATITAAGEVSVYGYADGALRRHGRVPWDNKTNDFMSAGPHFAVQSGTGASATTTTIYRTGDLRMLWRIRNEVGYVTGCGMLICSLDGGGVSGLDPSTGRELWRHPGLRGFRQVAPDRLLLDDGGPAGAALLVDAGTGRALGGPMYGSSFWGARSGWILVTRRTVEPPGRAAVIRLDLATAVPEMLGTTTPISDRGCSSAGRYLACRFADQVTVTAVD